MTAFQTVTYGDIEISYRPELDGGGTDFGQEFVPVVRRRFGRLEHAFEFCAGPGFIGFSLLANNLCDRLTLADINPAAVDACRRTIRDNQLESRVSVYLSDCFDDIPATERWDLVVSNPPHFLSTQDAYRDDLLARDPDWSIHRRFYSGIGEFLKPHGSILFQENRLGSRPEDFVGMISAGGLKVVDVFDSAWTERRNPVAAAVGNAARAPLKALRRHVLPGAVHGLISRTAGYRALGNLVAPSHSFYFIHSAHATPDR